VSVACDGRGCPRLPGQAGLAQRLTLLDGDRFRAGDVLRLTFREHGRTVRAVISIRSGERPSMQLAG
jgi:hypothetical protein